MDIELLHRFLLWCTAISYGSLLLWAMMFSLGHEWLYGMHSRWFQISRQQFDAIHYCGMGIYKVGIFLFNLIPLIALSIVK